MKCDAKEEWDWNVCISLLLSALIVPCDIVHTLYPHCSSYCAYVFSQPAQQLHSDFEALLQVTRLPRPQLVSMAATNVSAHCFPTACSLLVQVLSGGHLL